MQKNISKRLSIFVVTMMLMLMLPLTALADANSASLPDPTTKGKLTVHKIGTMSASNRPGDGLPLTDAEEKKLGEPLKGVEFTLYKVDDAVAKKWADDFAATGATGFDPAKLNPEDYIAGGTLVGAIETDINGVAVFDNLAVGYYVLKETKFDSTKYEPAATSFITMPYGVMNAAQAYEWNYDIHVYPKNVLSDKARKEFLGDHSYYTAGDDAPWRIEGKLLLPLKKGTAYGEIRITDKLDPRLTFDDTVKLEATGGKNGTYELKNNEWTFSKLADNTVEWEVTKAGLDALHDISATGIRVEFKTKVNGSATQTGPITGTDLTRIVNTATVHVKDADGKGESNPTTPDGETPPGFDVASISLNAREYDPGRPDNQTEPDLSKVPVPGVEFKVALSEDDAKKGTFIKQGKADNSAGTDDLLVITDVNGYGIFAGLPYDRNADKTFYLVMVKVPEGYVKSQYMTPVTVKKDDATAHVYIDLQLIGGPEVPEGRPTFKLPQTGGMGTVAFIAGGALLLALSLVMFRKSRREEY